MDDKYNTLSIAKISHLSVKFHTHNQILTAVDNITFDLKPGETLALLGESGCGKTMTSLALMRLLPNDALYGHNSKIDIDTRDILLLPEYKMRKIRGKRMAMIFQEPMTALNPVLTIRSQLLEAIPDYQKLSKKRLNETLINLLQQVEISEPALRLSQYPHQLSGGQKQRIVIAMAIANKPDILIADEPTTALDVTVQAQILALLKMLQQKQQMSLLLIIHDLSIVKAMADRVCVMYAGQIVEEAPVTEFFSQPKHPYTQQLLASLPTFDKRNKVLSVIEGKVPSLDALPSGCRFHPRCSYRFSSCSTNIPPVSMLENHLVRCHLYPQHSILPKLPAAEIKWVAKENSISPIFTVQNLCVEFKTKKHMLDRKPHVLTAVDNLSLSLYPGKTVALVGESGCGKTTASRALLRLIPITSGIINYQGKNIKQFKGKALRDYRKHVQIIFQDPYSSMNPRMTVQAILAEGMQAQGLKSEEIAQRQKKLLDQVNLPYASLTKYPHQFSGGQRQRISIARALALEPKILICDEPTSALDVSVQAQILNLLKQLQLELNVAYLFITHNMAVVSYLADEVLVMQKGRIVEQGPCEQIFTNPQHVYTQQLLSCVLGI